MTLPPVVLDSGTGSIKCGCAGLSPLPIFVCPTIIGRSSPPTSTPHPLLYPLSSGAFSSSRGVGGSRVADLRGPDVASSTPPSQQLEQAVLLCGGELVGQRATAEVTYPIRNGVIQDMAAMQHLWDYALCRRLPALCTSSAPRRPCSTRNDKQEAEIIDGYDWLERRPLFLTEPPNLSLKQRCDQLEIFFETYRFGAVQSMPQGVLSLFANGTESGVVVESGEGLSHCTPVFEGCVLTTAQRRLDLGGQAVTQYLAQLLMEGDVGGATGSGSSGSGGRAAPRRMSAATSGAMSVDVVRRLKERYCYVAVDPHNVDARLARETSALSRTCTLPDGTWIHLNAERFTAAEVLFNPAVVHVEAPGISAVLWDCVEAADVDVRRALYANIILSGGTTLLAGFGARLTRDMRASYLTEKLKGDASRMTRCPIAVRESPRRQFMAYMGGALMAELTAGQAEVWLSRAAYEEGGAAAVMARYHNLS